MTLTPMAAFLVAWLALYLYAVAAGIDFGAGALHAWARLRGHTLLADVIDRYMSPIWEVVNVFLVLFVVALVGFFPGAVRPLGTVMLLPGALGLGLIAVRAVAFVMAKLFPSPTPLFSVLLGAMGLLAPLPLVTWFPVVLGHGWLLQQGAPVLSPSAAFFSPLSLSFMVSALLSELSLAGLFLAWYAHAGQHEAAARLAVAPARLTLPLAGVALAVTLLLAHLPVSPTSLAGGAFAAGLLAWVAATWQGRQGAYGPALVLALAGQMAGFAGYALAQAPYLVRPTLTLAAAFTDAEMARTLTWVLGAGAAVVVPTLLLLGTFALRQVRRAPSRT